MEMCFMFSTRSTVDSIAVIAENEVEEGEEVEDTIVRTLEKNAR